MSEAVIAAMVSGGIALIGTIITVISTNSKTRADMQIAQTAMQTEIKHLTEEVSRHNNFAQRMPVVEEQIKVINHRIEDLERKES